MTIPESFLQLDAVVLDHVTGGRVTAGKCVAVGLSAALLSSMGYCSYQAVRFDISAHQYVHTLEQFNQSLK
jgi:hypothetical protein